MSVTTSPEAPPRPVAPETPPPRRSLVPAWLRNPWGQPRFLVGGRRGLYIAWALVPVAIAILFSFNAGRSRSVWQGFSFTLVVGRPHAVDLPQPHLHPRARAQPPARRRSTW